MKHPGRKSEIELNPTPAAFPIEVRLLVRSPIWEKFTLKIFANGAFAELPFLWKANYEIIKETTNVTL